MKTKNGSVDGRLKLFVFDFDGTILDTTLPGFLRVREILEILKLPFVSDEFLRRHWGKKFDELAALICHHVGVDGEYIAEFLRIEKTLVPKYQANPEVFGTLRDLRRRGFLTAMVTSRDIDSLFDLARQLNFDLSLFDYIQTPEDSNYHKPDGRVFAPLFDWAANRQCFPKDMIYFGDTVKYDLAAAQDSRPPLKFVGVVSGVNTASEFLRYQVSDLIYGVNGLPEYLKNLLKI